MSLKAAPPLLLWALVSEVTVVNDWVYALLDFFQERLPSISEGGRILSAEATVLDFRKQVGFEWLGMTKAWWDAGAKPSPLLWADDFSSNPAFVSWAPFAHVYCF